MNLVIVESPTKAKTLAKFLGPDYQIEASYGHIRDLPQKKMGIKISDGHFAPAYVQTKKQKDRTDQIARDVKKADHVYLATDPDREGEAISWHVKEILSGNKKSKTQFERIVFHEITKSAIDKAIVNPRGIDMQLVDAQQARRVLDRLVGYKLSPLLWKKVRKGLSAGRVQSVALRLIVEKEREITAFAPEEYWVVQVIVGTQAKESLTVTLIEKDEQKIKPANQAEADEVEKDLRASSYKVGSIEQKDFIRTPSAPFTTSALQQAGANRLGWSAKKTMQVAQNLYEQGLITYHRTDSVNLAPEAVEAVRSFISQQFGPDYLAEKPRSFQTKSKVAAQEAHEAIRPTDATVVNLPAEEYRDLQKLYELIWKRFVASQMAEARGETVTVDVLAQNGHVYKLQTKGETLKFDGWYKLWGKAEDLDENILPTVTQGEHLDFKDLLKTQKFTQPPARYNDASLIKTLEEMGIGRPSTYAPTISTILERLYVEKIDKRFQPSPLGMAVSDFLVTNFADVVDYDFTAKMEDNLDEIADGKREWEPTIAEFYTPFEKKLEMVTETAQKVKIEVEETGNPCPKCKEGKEVIRIGKFGKFIACSRFPDCDYKATLVTKTGQKCPKCQEGDVILKKTRSHKSFFGCSRYPDCDFASWTKPK